MALPLNKIETHRFISLNGESIAPLSKVDLYSRAGVNGLQAVHLGERGEPFTLRSTVDVANVEAGETLYLGYGALIGSTTEEFKLHDVDIAARDNAVLLILDVKKAMLRKFVKMVGGLNNNSTALLICDWQLVLLDKPA
jgi:hypothetical protein